MESWKKGRGELFEQLNNVYNQIGDKIASELNDDKFARISTEELRILRETSASVQKLAESHGRLTDELEVCREAVAKVEELEKENKRLAQELQTKLKQDSTPLGQAVSRVQHGNHFDATPRSSEPPSSVVPIEPGEPTQATLKKYEDLTKKYNKVCQKLEAMKGAKEMAERLAKEARARSQDWIDWGKGMEEKAGKRDEKIGKLKEEIAFLKIRLGGHEDSPQEESMSGQQPKTIKDIRNVLLPLPDIVNGRVQVPASSPPKALQHGLATDTARSNLGYVEANDVDGHSNESETDIPALGNNDTYIGDTSFEPLEAHHTSSTEGDPDPILSENKAGEDALADPEPETTEPSSPAVFISSRSVKKRKTRDQNPDQNPGPKIKVEVLELSSPHSPAPRYLDASESMDLDDIGEKVSTPRKAHGAAVVSKHVSRLVANSQTSTQSNNQSQVQSNTPTTSEPISNATRVRVETSVLQPRSANTRILPRTSDDIGRPSKKRKAASDQAISDLTEDGEIAPVHRSLKRQTSTENERLIELLTKPSPDRRVLSPQQTRSAKRPSSSILSALGRPSPKISSAASTSTLAHKLPGNSPHTEPKSLNVNAYTSKPSKDPTHSSRSISAKTSRDTDDLIALQSKRIIPDPVEASKSSSSQVPKSSAESFQPSPKPSSRSSNGSSIPEEGVFGRSPSPFLGTQLPPRRDLASAFISRSVREVAKDSPRTPAPDRSGRSTNTTAKKRHIRTEADYEMDPDQEPLRARPVGKLTLADFKINPNYNQGYDFAFNEVVRGKEARASLEGCIKPDCCGPMFTGLAKAELDLRRPTLSQEERDEALLEDYLGTGADRIKYMSKAEREETLVEAKTRELANKHGRHRHAYDTGGAPPGFWRADFPTTQEEVEDRVMGKARERELVKQRQLQAMRPGGAYLFRDE